jgi:hypothetical protein
MESNLTIGAIASTSIQTNGDSAHVAQSAAVDAAAKLNSAHVAGPDNEIIVTMNGHRLEIQVVNRETREIVEQIAPPSLLRMYKRLTVAD